MITVLAALAVSVGSAGDASCLAPLQKDEQRQDEAARKTRSKAGNLPVLEPDDDQLPSGLPADFTPQLVILSFRTATDGSATDCIVDVPGAIAILANASCTLLQAHYRAPSIVSPAKPRRIAVLWTPPAIRPERRNCNNNHGTVPVSSNHWINSGVFNGAGFQSGSALIALDVSDTGRIEHCSVLAATISSALQRNLCIMARRNAVVLPALVTQNTPALTQTRFVVRFQLDRR